MLAPGNKTACTGSSHLHAQTLPVCLPRPYMQEGSWKQQLVIDNLWSLAVVGELVGLVLHYNAAMLTP